VKTLSAAKARCLRALRYDLCMQGDKLSGRDSALWRGYLEILSERVPLLDHRGDGDGHVAATRSSKAFVVLTTLEPKSKSSSRNTHGATFYATTARGRRKTLGMAEVSPGCCLLRKSERAEWEWCSGPLTSNSNVRQPPRRPAQYVYIPTARVKRLKELCKVVAEVRSVSRTVAQVCFSYHGSEQPQRDAVTSVLTRVCK